MSSSAWASSATSAGVRLVQAHPDVIDILAIEERDTLDQLERRYRKQLYLQAVADYHIERFEVTGDKREKGERRRRTGTHRTQRLARGRDGQGEREASGSGRGTASRPLGRRRWRRTGWSGPRQSRSRGP